MQENIVTGIAFAKIHKENAFGYKYAGNCCKWALLYFHCLSLCIIVSPVGKVAFYVSMQFSLMSAVSCD